MWLAGIGAVALHAGQTPPAHVALRTFVPRGIAAAPPVALPAPPQIKGSSAPPMLATLLFDPFFAAPLPQSAESDADKQLASVSGVVITTSGTPVAGAQVILIPTSPLPSTPGGRPPQPPTVFSGADGKFALEKIPPGAYRLMVSHPAYLSPSGSALPGAMPGIQVTLSAGQRMENLSLKFAEPATVTGRVVDEDGDPMGFVDVLVMRPGYYIGRRTRFSVATVISKDDGTFRVERVPAGQYYLRVSARGLHTIPERAPVPAPKPGQKDLRPDSTYYGGGHEPEGAMIIDIGAGQNISMGDVKMLDELFVHVRGKVVGDPALLVGARVVRMNGEPTSGYGWSFGADIQKDVSPKAASLDGTVVDEDGNPVSGTVTLVPEPARPGHGRLYPSATADQQGRFSFPSVTPGKYKVYAWEDIDATAHWDPNYIRPFESRGESVEVTEGGHASVSLKRIPAAVMRMALRKAGL